MATTRKTSSRSGGKAGKPAGTTARAARTSRAGASTKSTKPTRATKAAGSAAATSRAASSTTMAKASGLRKWNIAAAVVLFIEAVAIAVLGSSSAGSRGIIGNYLTLDTLQTKVVGRAVYVQGTHRLFDFSLLYLVPAFLLAGALAHLTAATWYRHRYEANLVRRRNVVRWLATAVSGALVLATVAMVNGVLDLSSLLMIMALAVITAIFSYLLEVTKRRTADGEAVRGWVINTIAIAAGLVPWLVIGMYLKDAVVYGTGLPQYIYWLDGTAFVLFVALAVNFFLSGRGTGRWSDYLFGERVCIALAVGLSSAVAWQVFAGTLHP